MVPFAHSAFPLLLIRLPRLARMRMRTRLRLCVRVCVVFSYLSAYGSVYKALHKSTSIELAIKSVLLGREEQVEVEKEIDILKDCRHPNVVAYYGCCAHRDYLWVGRVVR
jgi:Protein kinase domain